MVKGWQRRLMAVILIGSIVSNGCDLKKPVHYLGDADLHYYKDAATQVDYPYIYEETPDEVKFTDEPRTIVDRRKDEIWDMTLVEAIHTAMANSSVIRSDASFGTAGNPILASPDAAPAVYDPAIQETGVLFGNRGVEAALAAFDAQLDASMVWGRNEAIQNNIFFGGGLDPGGVLTTETGNFNVGLSKQFAHGGLLAVNHNWDYLGSNAPAQLFPSAYTGSVGAQYRQPLWAGAGTEFTRIAGPIAQAFGGLTGVNQGVLIARINTDITIAEFEASVQRLLIDVESLYWDLYLSYRVYDTAITARNSALRSWREAKARLDVGGVANFKPADEAQARDRYFETRAQAETALSQIYTTEVRLRRLLGLPVNDGRVIRPVDEPATAEFTPDWYISLTEALTQRVELRRQKWNIKSLELQLKAASSLTNPRLDFVSGYRVNAFGDRLFGSADDGITNQGLRSAYRTLTRGNQTGWDLGFEMTMPIGFRSAQAQVRNIELRLAKARDVLATQELEISHELAAAVQEVAAQYATAQSNFNRRRAAQRRLELFEAELQAGTVTLDEVLRAQASLADAENAYYSSLIGYNQAIADLQFRKGTILVHNNVFMAEGEWTPEAYGDAFHRAQARSHAIENRLLHDDVPPFALPGYGGHVELAIPADKTLEELEQEAGVAVPPAPPSQPEGESFEPFDDEPAAPALPNPRAIQEPFEPSTRTDLPPRDSSLDPHWFLKEDRNSASLPAES